MMTRYRYNRQIDPPAPFVHVAIRRPVEPSGATVENVPAQLDTAADFTTIPTAIVDELQLVPLDEMLVAGFGGHLTTLPTYLVLIGIRELDAVPIKVLASKDEPYVLVGRDILNRHRVLLDGPQLVFEID
jgi:hypothetical protein